MSPDPLAIHALGSDLNPYAYVGGSPMRFVDPLGLSSDCYDEAECEGGAPEQGNGSGNGGGNGNDDGNGYYSNGGAIPGGGVQQDNSKLETGGTTLAQQSVGVYIAPEKPNPVRPAQTAQGGGQGETPWYELEWCITGACSIAAHNKLLLLQQGHYSMPTWDEAMQRPPMIGGVAAEFAPVVEEALAGLADELGMADTAAVRGIRGAEGGGMATVRQLGTDGEVAANIVKNTDRIPSASGTAAYRIPDVLDHVAQVIGDVKNIGSLSYTSQLRDFASYAQTNGYQFQLWVRPTTELSGPLSAQVANGNILLRFF
jgi:hypothetical protein